MMVSALQGQLWTAVTPCARDLGGDLVYPIHIHAKYSAAWLYRVLDAFMLNTMWCPDTVFEPALLAQGI